MLSFTALIRNYFWLYLILMLIYDETKPELTPLWVDPCPWWSWWIRQTIFSDADPANNCNNSPGCHPCTYLSSDRGRYTSSGGDNSVSVGAMEINRRAGANRGNEAAQQRAAGRRSRRQGRAFTFNFYLSSLTHNTQCRNGRWQKAQVINFMFTSTTAAAAATNLWEYVGFKG